MVNIERKTCSLAVASIRCAVYGLVLIGLAILYAMPGYKNHDDRLELGIFALGVALQGAAFIVGIISLARLAQNKGLWKGKNLAVIGISIPMLFIIGALLMSPCTVDSMDKARTAGIVGDLRNIEIAAKSYKKDIGSWPGTGAEDLGFVKNNNVKGWDGPYLDKWPVRNPWGGVYVFHNDNKFGPSAKSMVYVTATKVPLGMARKIDKRMDNKIDLDKGIIRYRDGELYFLIDVSN